MSLKLISCNEQRFKALRDLSIAIDDAEKLGLDKTSIYKSLKKAKTPHITELSCKTVCSILSKQSDNFRSYEKRTE